MTWCRCAFSSPMINWILPDQCVEYWGLRCHQNCCREFLVRWIISSAIQFSWFSRSWPIHKSVLCFLLQSTIIHEYAFKFWLSNRYSSPANSLNLSQSVIVVKISVAVFSLWHYHFYEVWGLFAHFTQLSWSCFSFSRFPRTCPVVGSQPVTEHHFIRLLTSGTR